MIVFTVTSYHLNHHTRDHLAAGQCTMSFNSFHFFFLWNHQNVSSCVQETIASNIGTIHCIQEEHLGLERSLSFLFLGCIETIIPCQQFRSNLQWLAVRTKDVTILTGFSPRTVASEETYTLLSLFIRCNLGRLVRVSLTFSFSRAFLVSARSIRFARRSRSFRS